MVLKCYICKMYDPKTQSMYRIPNRNEGHSERWRLWLKILCEEERNIHKIRICSNHFFSKKPAKKDDYLNVDWVPSLNMGVYTKNKTMHNYFLRTKNGNPSSPKENQVEEAISNGLRIKEVMVDGHHQIQQCNEVVADKIQINENDNVSSGLILPPIKKRKFEDVEQIFFLPKEVQTQLTFEDINLLFEHYQKVVEDRDRLLLRISTLTWDYEFFKDNDHKTLFYTGLPTWKLLNHFFNFIEPFLPEHGNSKLSPFQMLVLTLIKLRLNLLFIDLGYRFQVDATTASRYFHRCVSILYKKFYESKMIHWPKRENLFFNTPSYFRDSFKDLVTVIIDCFEIFIERPSVLLAQSQSWSQYKHHTTIKYLIGISISGAIIFISQGFGGRTSDKEITLRSKILDNLEEGDLVLADKGFIIAKEVEAKKAALHIPCFVNNGNQLLPNEVEETRHLASVRIHVERLISVVRQKFNMCSDVAPMVAISKKNDLFENDLYDKVVYVCCCLVNLCPSVVRNDFEI